MNFAQSRQFSMKPANRLQAIVFGLTVTLVIGAAAQVGWSQTKAGTKAGTSGDSSPEKFDGTAPADRPMTPREIYLKTLNSTVFIVTDKGTGTGWVWDPERQLVVTNDHVVEGATDIVVYFPIYEEDVLQVEPEFYREKVEPVKAEVIDSEQGHDLAIIRLKSLPQSAQGLELAERSAAPGERVHAVGGRPYGSEGLWKYSTGFVSQVASADISQTGVEVMALQSNIDINPGNSGGPVVNDEGKVVGVAQSIIRDAQSVSYSVDVASIRQYLAVACPLVDADTAEAKLELARRNRGRGRLDTAMMYLNAALKQDNQSAESYSLRGWTFLDMGDFVTAVADFDQALELDGSQVEALRGRSLAHRRTQEYDKALTDISRAIAEDASNADLYNARAIIQENLEKNDLALIDYGRALTLNSQNAIFLGNRADLYLNLRRYRDAITDLAKALQLNPANAWLQHMTGLAHYRLEEYADAMPYLSKAVELEQDNVRYVSDWADNAQALGNHDLGIQLWSRAIELDEEYPYAYYSRAWSLRRLGRLPAALADMDRAIGMAGDESPAYYYQERGLVYQDLGKSDEAEQDFAKARSLDPESYAANAAAPPNDTVVGRWYVNQNIKGAQFEMTHEYRADGSYQGVAKYTQNGESDVTEEQGTYTVHDGFIRFSTNQGNYDQPYKFEKGMFWLYFDNLEFWIGSIRK